MVAVPLLSVVFGRPLTSMKQLQLRRPVTVVLLLPMQWWDRSLRHKCLPLVVQLGVLDWEWNFNFINSHRTKKKSYRSVVQRHIWMWVTKVLWSNLVISSNTTRIAILKHHRQNLRNARDHIWEPSKKWPGGFWVKIRVFFLNFEFWKIGCQNVGFLVNFRLASRLAALLERLLSRDESHVSF